MLNPEVNQSDDKLVLDIQNGSEEAFAQLYKKYEGKMMGYLVFKLKNQEIAEEIFQITWTKVLNNIHKYKLIDSFSSWIFTITTNTYKDWFKKIANQTKALEAFKNQTEIDESIKAEDYSSDLKFDFLKADAQKIIELQYVQGLSSKDISDQMNIQESNVRKIASRARSQIKQHILNGGSL